MSFESYLCMWMKSRTIFTVPILIITLRVPIYSISSWTSLVSRDAAMFIDPIRDVYEVGRASLNIMARN